jgi:hypothetical protein
MLFHYLIAQIFAVVDPGECAESQVLPEFLPIWILVTNKCQPLHASRWRTCRIHSYHRCLSLPSHLFSAAGAAVVAGDDALDAGWFSADEIEAGMRGRVTGDCARVIHRADLLRRAGCLSLPALNPSWLRMGGESSA